jgi:hypothetical protein
VSGDDNLNISMSALLTSPRLRGEVGAKRRVRGAIHESEPVESPPHPNPLRASFARLDPARGERESQLRAILPA